MFDLVWISSPWHGLYYFMEIKLIMFSRTTSNAQKHNQHIGLSLLNKYYWKDVEDCLFKKKRNTKTTLPLQLS